jgi:hypothetical protein
MAHNEQLAHCVGEWGIMQLCVRAGFCVRIQLCACVHQCGVQMHLWVPCIVHPCT